MKQRIIVKILCSCILLSNIWINNSLLAIETNFPDVGSETALETEIERKIGNMIMQKIYGSDFLISDPIVNSYLQKLAVEFNKHLPHSDFTLHFFGVNTPELNAFAFFGGHVAVHSGLILAVANESELAAVLAHETAHIAQRHLARMVTENRKMLPLTYAEILAAIAIGALGAPEAGAHLANAAMAGHAQQMINFTREHEQEADRIGIQLLSHTSFDPAALASVFQRMKQQSMYNHMPPEYLLTHPLFESRIADAQNRARSLPTKQATNSLFFYLVRARLEIEKGENTKRKLARLKEALVAGRYQNKTAARYGYALALLKNQQPQEALLLLQELTTENPNQFVLELSLAEAEQATGHLDRALNRTHHLLEIYPNNYPILLQYATLLLQNKQPQKVINLLKAQRKQHDDDPIIHQMLARSYSMLRQPVELHRAQAEWHLTRGEFKEALQQLDLALEYAENNKAILKTIRDRKEAILDIQKAQREIKL